MLGWEENPPRRWDDALERTPVAEVPRAVLAGGRDAMGKAVRDEVRTHSCDIVIAPLIFALSTGRASRAVGRLGLER